jgi:hypothetical protein
VLFKEILPLILPFPSFIVPVCVFSFTKKCFPCAFTDKLKFSTPFLLFKLRPIEPFKLISDSFVSICLLILTDGFTDAPSPIELEKSRPTDTFSPNSKPTP